MTTSQPVRGLTNSTSRGTLCRGHGEKQIGLALRNNVILRVIDIETCGQKPDFLRCHTLLAQQEMSAFGEVCARITVKQPRIGASIMAELILEKNRNEAVPDARFSSHGYLDF